MATLAKPDHPPRVIVLCIGNELRGDDAAGIAVARALCAKLNKLPLSQSIRVVEAGTAPENFTGMVRQFCPDLVLFVDAAQMDAAPGSIRWLEPESSMGLSASTHSLPLSMVARYLHSEVGSEVGLLGIQPGHDLPLAHTCGRTIRLSGHVRQAVNEIVRETSSILMGPSP